MFVEGITQILSKLTHPFLVFVHFAKALALQPEMANEPVFLQPLIYTGKDRMTWNTTNWKPLVHTIFMLYIRSFLIHCMWGAYLWISYCHGIHEKFQMMLSRKYFKWWCCDIFKGHCFLRLVPTKNKMLLLLTENLQRINSW